MHIINFVVVDKRYIDKNLSFQKVTKTSVA